LSEPLYQAFVRKFRDATNQGHYQCDYATKANPEVGSVLDEQAIGIDRLRKAELEAASAFPAGEGLSEEERQRHIGCRTAVRLQTAENRASLNKSSEMAFQELRKHEAYVSHSTWTLFCKGLIWSAFEASRFRQIEARGGSVESLDVLANMETDWPQMHGDDLAPAESKPAESVFFECCL
jgi:hypothetical protein